MRVMEIGRLNKRLTIMGLKEYEDSMGQTYQKLSPLKTVWGSLAPTRGQEYYEAQKLRSRVTYKIYIRYIHEFEVTTSNLISYLDHLYEIESVNNVDMENKMLEIYATEFTNDEGYHYE